MERNRPFKKFERPEKAQKPQEEEEDKPRRAKKPVPFKKPIKTETPQPVQVVSMRLNKYISNSGVCSRRDADKLIEAGEVTVNDKVVTEMGHKVGKDDVVKHNDKLLNPEKLVYVLLNKPKDFLTTMDDPQGRKTVMTLIKNAANERVYPVGRLDRNTTGLLLFTNDGDLAKKLSHPSHKVRKLYQVELDKPLTENHFQDIQEGLKLEDGIANVNDLAVVGGDKRVIGIDIHIGKNRIVRRIFEHLGYDVVKLDRTIYAGLTKKDLGRGKWRLLAEKEIIKLKHMK
jgi:23S rRNA pseudouridine2605 synthase